MTYERDAWDETGDMGNGIEGQHLKCAKDKWLLAEEEIETGDNGLKICVIMDTATVGQVLWQDHKIVERDVGRIADGFVPPRQLLEGRNPYVSFVAVRADNGHIGELCTFTSSSWGGRYAFQGLVNPYRLKERRQFPICVLGTKERGDENRNIDPVFKIVSWSDRAPTPSQPASKRTRRKSHNPCATVLAYWLGTDIVTALGPEHAVTETNRIFNRVTQQTWINPYAACKPQ